MTRTSGSTGNVLVRLTTYVPIEVRDQVDAWANREKRTRANAARHFLESWLLTHPAPADAPSRVLNVVAAVGPTGFGDDLPEEATP